MALEPGDQAPDFSLPRTPGEPPVSLAELLADGPAVLLFFPLAWSSVCTRELCRVRDDYADYGALDATVAGISVDSPFTLQAWAREQGFPFPLLSDFNCETSAAYGALYEDFFGLQGVSKRAVFVVDGDGVVRHAEVLEDAGELPDLAAAREVLAALQPSRSTAAP